MSEMIERVAKTIAESIQITCDNDRCMCSGAERWDCILSTTPEKLARVAIEAMREPTEVMANVGIRACKDKYDVPHAYRDMIDAALSTEPASVD